MSVMKRIKNAFGMKKEKKKASPVKIKKAEPSKKATVRKTIRVAKTLKKIHK